MDPPWDINIDLPYGTISDDDMRRLALRSLQTDGYIFLWVTGRAMELGRELLTEWAGGVSKSHAYSLDLIHHHN